MKPKNLVCPRCDKAYCNQASFDKHVRFCKVVPSSTPSELLSLVFNFTDDYFTDDVSDEITESAAYLHELATFAYNNPGFKFIHLNVNSLNNKKEYIAELADKRTFDMILLNETKLHAKHDPKKWFEHNHYTIIRKDRDDGSRGGGIMILVKKEYNIISWLPDNKYELLFLQLSIKNKVCNFVCCYKSPSINSTEFITYFDNYLLQVDLSLPLFVIGDLNFDLKSSYGEPLRQIMDNYQLTNFVEKSTRVAHRSLNRLNRRLSGANNSPDGLNSTKLRPSSTLIDVILHNSDLIKKSEVIGCPFSDHMFVVAALTLPANKNLPAAKIQSRCLSQPNLKKVEEHIKAHCQDFLQALSIDNPEEKLKFIQSHLIQVLDLICPVRSVSKRSGEDSHPWNDSELQHRKWTRNMLYDHARQTKDKADWSKYIEARKLFQTSNRKKMIEYFESKGIRDFKNSKKFWEFYRSSIKLKSDASSSDMPSTMMNGNLSASTPEDIAYMFNSFFTSISSISLSSEIESNQAIDDIFTRLKNERIIKAGTFKFHQVSEDFVSKLIARMDDSSSPGNAGISPKVLKLAPEVLTPVYTSLFNSCIAHGIVPAEWKSATVTPLFKNKGVNSDVNNYRGISVLAPLSKIFEKVLNEQIVNYFDHHELMFKGQHGFRKGHSCETALHELISDMNSARDRKLISLLLFIDYRKAFDTVDSNLLLRKLFHYGFDKSATSLIGSYFKERSQVTKVNGKLSSKANIPLGVPQGSCLGPLFFLIFINDLAFLLEGVTSKLFADDTTIYLSGPDLDNLLTDFKRRIEPLDLWCRHNRLDVNWSKTYAMFITNKRINKPASVLLNGTAVSTVKEFKLLGVTIDDRLNFDKHVAIVCRQINSKLFSIKRLFQLSTSVKVQFFKTFVLPYFDYCASLAVYYPNSLVQKLTNCYFTSLSLLFKFCHDKFKTNSCPGYRNKFLEKYGLSSYQHRLLVRILSFANKIFFSTNPLAHTDLQAAPFTLKSLLCMKESRKAAMTMCLRSRDELDTTKSRTDYGHLTFGHVFPKLINFFGVNMMNEVPSRFQSKLKKNINQTFEKFKECIVSDTLTIFSKTFFI